MATIVDPRRRQQLGLPPLSYGAGTLNNAAPSFQGPAYYNQMFNRPIQDWSQFMPTNSPLAGGGGINYQNPWGYGTGGGSGWGGAFGGGGGGFPGGGFMGGGGGYGGGYPGWGGGYPGGFTPRPNPTFVPGGQDYFPTMTPWDMPTDGSLPGPRPGSDKASDLAAGSTHHPEMYDADDMWVGAEGGGAAEAGWTGGGAGGGGAGGVPWQDTFMAPLGNRLGWNFAGYDPGQGQDMGTSIDDMLDAEEMSRAGIPDPRTGGRVHSGPLAYSPPATNAVTGLLGPTPLQEKQAFMTAVDTPPAMMDDFSAGYFGPQVDDFANINAQPQVNLPGPQESWSAPVARPAPAPVSMGVGVHPGIASTMAPSPMIDTFSTQADKTAMMRASTANAAAAAQQKYLANLDDESARRMNQMSQAQIANAMQAEIDAAGPEGPAGGYAHSGFSSEAGFAGGHGGGYHGR